MGILVDTWFDSNVKVLRLVYRYLVFRAEVTK